MEDVAPPFFVNGSAELAPTYTWGNRIGTTARRRTWRIRRS